MTPSARSGRSHQESSGRPGFHHPRRRVGPGTGEELCPEISSPFRDGGHPGEQRRRSALDELSRDRRRAVAPGMSSEPALHDRHDARGRPDHEGKTLGRIINMTRLPSSSPSTGSSCPNTVRSGVIGFAKSLSNELASFNVTVNSVCPGYTMTDRVRNLAKVLAEKQGRPPRRSSTNGRRRSP